MTLISLTRGRARPHGARLSTRCSKRGEAVVGTIDGPVRYCPGIAIHIEEG
jgi:hypothetical protein